MVGDDMEISSEHGRNVGDEDIDIDIDLTTGQADEDYILDDVEPHEGFQDGPQHNTLQDVNTDDLMIDDDDNSYVMDDADVEPDGGRMESETMEMPYATEQSVNDPFVDMDPEALVQHTTDTSIHAAEISWEQPEQPQQAGGLLSEVTVETETGDSNGASNQSETLVYDTSSKKPVDIPEEATEQSEPKESIKGSPPAVEEERPLSPPEVVTEVHSPAIEQSDSHADTVHELAATEDRSDGDDNQAETGKVLASPPNITVVYQAAEYALFSTSEHDDPDSYFLRDMSIMQKSLSTFFSSIRDIIQDDLSAEDELCLAVEVLGLETDEASASLMQDVTLNQVVDVYQKLLQNDGVEADHPLSIMLSIRPKFTTRLVSLISQAAEGHGLSKVITWHDDSESADDTAEIAQNGSLQVHKSQDDTHNGISQVSPDEVNGQEATDVAYTPQKEISSEPQQAIEMTKPETASHETSGENQTLDSSTFVPIATEEGLQHEDKEGSATGNNEKEENDLLDYDDEDVHQVDNSDRPLVREAKADQDNTKTEYAVTNEDPHPESTFAEEHIPEQTNEHEGNIHLEEYDAPPEREEDSGQYDEKSDDAEHEDNQDAQHEEDESDGPEDDQTHHQAASGDYIHDELSYEHEGATHEEFTYGSSELAERTTAAGDTDTHATFEDKSNSDRQYDNVDEQEDPEEPEYNGVDGEEEQEYDETGEEEPTYTYSAIENRGEEDTTRDNSSIATSPAQNNPTSSNFTFTDLVESESATMSANTLEADEIDLGEAQDEIENGVDHNTPDANEYELKEQEDEIDYDDEDESEVVEHQKTPVPEITSEPNGSSGKRLRADAGLEDILDEDSQEAKRPRS